VALLLGMQLRYTKYCCLLYEWDSRDKKNHHVNELWPKRTSLTPREKNVVNPPLVRTEKIFLPSLPINPGLMNNFVKGMDKPGRGFEYLRNKFPNVSDAKIKEVILIGHVSFLVWGPINIYLPSGRYSDCLSLIYATN